MVLTTHRYDTIRQTDTMVVLLVGRLAEMGTYETLTANACEFSFLNLAQKSVASLESASIPVSHLEEGQ